MAETEETPQIDETRLQAIRRRIEEVVGDAPQLAKLALEQMVTKHNPDLKGTAGSAGRVGAQSGNVSELTAIANLKPGGADRLKRIFGLVNGNFDGAQKVGTLHNMRFVFFDNDTRIHASQIGSTLAATSIEGQSYLLQLAQTMMAQGSDPALAQQQAQAMLSNTINREAAIMAYNQVFYVMGIFLLIASALMLLLRQPAPRAADAEPLEA